MSSLKVQIVPGKGERYRLLLLYGLAIGVNLWYVRQQLQESPEGQEFLIRTKNQIVLKWVEFQHRVLRPFVFIEADEILRMEEDA